MVKVEMVKGIVTTIHATPKGPSTFYLATAPEPGRQVYVSDSPLILNALLPALLSRATVELYLESGSNTIQRVQPYELGQRPPLLAGQFVVHRIATQRNPDTKVDHLEVFLTKPGDDKETAYNIFDLFLQNIFLAAFRPVPPLPYVLLDVQVQGTTIIAVALGEGSF
jgi:hypothetical protein